MTWQSEPRRLPVDDVHRVMLASSPLDAQEQETLRTLDMLDRVLADVEIAAALARGRLTVIEGGA